VRHVLGLQFLVVVVPVCFVVIGASFVVIGGS